MSRQLFLDAVGRRAGEPVYGTGTSIACHDLMRRVGVYFPEAHMDAEKMAALAMAGHSVLGLDVVMPLFSVCHEAAAMGCDVHWGQIDMMPEARGPIFRDSAGLCGFHWDTKSGSPRSVRELAGPNLVLMGGISNRKLWQGTPEEIAADAEAACAAGIDIVGPECAIPLTTPLANLMAITAARVLRQGKHCIS